MLNENGKIIFGIVKLLTLISGGNILYNLLNVISVIYHDEHHNVKNEENFSNREFCSVIRIDSIASKQFIRPGGISSGPIHS